MEIFGRLTVCSMLLCLTSISSTLDSIAPTQPLRDNQNETLVSPGGVFVAGFFSPDDSMSRYVGIWYKNIPERTIVWVANRDKPVYDTSGVLKIDSGRGILGIFHSGGIEIWSSDTSKKAEKPILQLLDSGNLVLRDDNNLQSILWQSFDYPGDTFLPGMKIGSNLRTGQYMALTSWNSPQDPTPGEFSMLINTTGLPQLVITQGGGIINRVGSWNGVGLTGNPELNTIKFLKFFFELSEDEVFYRYQVLNSSILTRAMISSQGYLLRYTWSSQTNRWNLSFSSQFGQCEIYASCGANTNCYVNGSKNCECLRGFTASEEGGCVRTTPLECNKVDSFQNYRGIKLPDTSSSWYDKSIHLRDCEKLCLRNCSCTAYSSLYISDGGSGCLHWLGDIVDLTQLAEGGQAFYIRVSANMTVKNRTLGKKKIAGIMVGCIIFIMGIVVLGLTLWIQKTKLTQPGTRSYWKDRRNKEHFDLPIFAFSTIANATNQFSESNKLGQGGFGPVYKVGILADGQEIAVKRLSETSKQGMDEFKNEVLLIAKLQHRNLVKLLGCTIQQDEKLLIYEFMPNRSLDYFIFDSVKSKLLDWAQRFKIIDGIARGLLYLHHDSRLIIIHRDLKASNILLDKSMNPKISDFGLARTFGGDQVEANTNRAMGTYGYMPPEYVMHGDFSIKSDVYSFGVIVLEIISGRKIRGFCDPHHHLNLLGHAWRLWIEERPTELMDELLHDSATTTEVLRCIQVGLLCVQQRPEDRPNMSTVVLMLNGEKLLPQPRQPGFYTGKDNPSSTQIDSTIKGCQECSVNEISFSLFKAR